MHRAIWLSRDLLDERNNCAAPIERFEPRGGRAKAMSFWENNRRSQESAVSRTIWARPAARADRGTC